MLINQPYTQIDSVVKQLDGRLVKGGRGCRGWGDGAVGQPAIFQDLQGQLDAHAAWVAGRTWLLALLEKLQVVKRVQG